MQGYLHFSFLIFLGKKKEKKFSLLQCHGKTWKCKPAVGSRHSGSCNGKKAGMVLSAEYETYTEHPASQVSC